jgi:hypothetical protein
MHRLLLVLLISAGLLWLCHSGSLYQTGAQYYQTCWDYEHPKQEGLASADQAAQWATCKETAQAASYGAGFVFSGNPARRYPSDLLSLRARSNR